MYKVYCDNTLMHDPRIEELALLNPVVNLEENKAGSFSFTIPPEHPKYEDIKRRKSVIQVFQDEELIFSGMCIEVQIDFYKQKYVYCEGELAYLNDSIQRPARYQGMTVRGLLEAYINSHNAQVEAEKQFTVGMVTVTDPNNYIYCYSNMETTMQCLKDDLVDDLGGFIRIRHENGIKYIDYLADSQNTNTQIIKLGVNLLDFKSNIDTSDIATAIIPLGAIEETQSIEGLETRLTIKSVNNGCDYVFNQSAVNSYGMITKTVEFNNVTVPSVLKSKGEKYLQETQFENVVIEATAIDLHIAKEDIERFKLSDKIRVLSEPHGLNKYFRLTKQTINLNNPENDKITLGKNEKLSLSSTTGIVNEAVRKAMKSIVPASDILSQAKSSATALINGNGGNGFVVIHNNEDGKPYEILIMDTDNIETATKVWRWNQNGFGYSNTGYNGTYGTAITMDGSIVADFITAGTINGVNISGVNMSGSNIASTGSITKYATDYSSADVSRAVEIVKGTVNPTNSDYEKLDLNNDGLITSSDVVAINNFVNGTTSSKTVNTTVSMSATNSKDTIKTENVAVGNGYVRTKNLVVTGNIRYGNPSASTYSEVFDTNKGEFVTAANGIYTIGGTQVKVINGLIAQVGGTM